MDSINEREKGKPEAGQNSEIIPHLKGMAVRGLKRMFLPREKRFVFRLRKNGHGVISEGVSRRYTAIALIGLAEESESVRASILGHHSLNEVCEGLVKEVLQTEDLGDAALTLWAAKAIGYPYRKPVWDRLFSLLLAEQPFPTVEAGWALSAFSLDHEMPFRDLQKTLALWLKTSFNPTSSLFPHVLGKEYRGMRSHVACFADQVYPIHALSTYAKQSGDQEALEIAIRCADRICGLQGPAGQWWWHYDLRTGKIVEPYPVYAVHQDAMAPMALFALQESSGLDYTEPVSRGLAWLTHSPELGGDSLIDEEGDIIWRKVCRRDPKKIVRGMQAVASKVHPTLRVPCIDLVFPPGGVDYEDRPYHLGWLLYAWSKPRLLKGKVREEGS